MPALSSRITHAALSHTTLRQVFDLKLRHMRDDIAAIEASNNSLECQASHNAGLLALLSELLGAVALDPNLACQLERPALDPYK
jgi:hypothetical protein